MAPDDPAKTERSRHQLLGSAIPAEEHPVRDPRHSLDPSRVRPIWKLWLFQWNHWNQCRSWDFGKSRDRLVAWAALVASAPAIL